MRRETIIDTKTRSYQKLYAHNVYNKTKPSAQRNLGIHYIYTQVYCENARDIILTREIRKF